MNSMGGSRLMCCCLSDAGWEWGAEGRSLWSDRSTQFSSRREPETPCQTGEPRAGPKGIELQFSYFLCELCLNPTMAESLVNPDVSDVWRLFFCLSLKAYARGRRAKAAAGIGTWAGSGYPKVQTGWDQKVAAGKRNNLMNTVHIKFDKHNVFAGHGGSMLE